MQHQDGFLRWSTRAALQQGGVQLPVSLFASGRPRSFTETAKEARFFYPFEAQSRLGHGRRSVLGDSVLVGGVR